MKEDFKKELLELQARCSNFERVLLDISKKMDGLCQAALHRETKIRALDALDESIEQNICEQKKNLFEFKTDVSNNFTDIHRNIEKLRDSIVSLIDDQKKIIQEVISENEKNNIRFDTTNTNFSLIREEIDRKIEKSIEAIPKPKIPSQQEIQNLIEFKIEPISLDTKNANLRSSHNDMRTLILEKKVENILLILKKNSVE